MEFKELINKKLDKAREDYEILKSAITQSESNDTQDNKGNINLFNICREPS